MTRPRSDRPVRTRRTRPTEQLALRIRCLARPSLRPITRGTSGRWVAEVAEAVVAEAEVVVVVAVAEVAEAVAVVAEVAVGAAEVAEAVVAVVAAAVAPSLTLS